MSKYVWKTPHTIYFCKILNFWVYFTYVYYVYDQPILNLNNWCAKDTTCNKLAAIFTRQKTTDWMYTYFGLYIRWKFRKHSWKHSGHGSVHLWHHSGISLFCSFYEVLQHANQSTNFCLTTLESSTWNFLICIKREVLVIDICGKSCWPFSTKNCLRILPDASLGCKPIVNNYCIIPTGFSWILCKSNPHQLQNK